MLEYANKYKNELYKLFINVWNKEKYKYLFSNSCSYLSHILEDTILDNTWNEHHFVSIYQGKILGYISYNISRTDNRVYGLEIVSFADKNMVFSVDLKRILQNIFEVYKFRKINFLVVIGNPIEKQYDRLVLKYNGRIVGIREKHNKLFDNKYYDVKEYEIFRDGYLNAKEKLNGKNINSEN